MKRRSCCYTHGGTCNLTLEMIMRLNEYQVSTIVDAVVSRFGSRANIYLFGSRLDDKLRGGDIDLFIDLPVVDHETVRHSCQALADIQILLGDQKIDIVVRHPKSLDQAIFHEALTQGVLLH